MKRHLLIAAAAIAAANGPARAFERTAGGVYVPKKSEICSPTIIKQRESLLTFPAMMFGSAGAWQNAAGPITLNADVGGWNGFTVRQVIEDAQLTFPASTSQIRVTFEAGSAEGLTLTEAYVQNGAAAGDSYDFASAPVQLLFSASASTTISAGQQKVSDDAAFTRVSGRRLVISFYINGGTGADTTRSKATETGWSALHKNASDASTVDATGYTTTNNIIGVARVEAFG